MSEQICGGCLLPIHPSDGGLRHYGWHTKHQEGRCIDLLRQQIAALTQERDALRETSTRAGVLNQETIAELSRQILTLEEHKNTSDCAFNDIVAAMGTKVKPANEIRDEEWEQLLSDIQGMTAENAALTRQIAEAREMADNAHQLCILVPGSQILAALSPARTQELKGVKP